MKKRIIAIDYGRKRIGIAITDKEQLLALPFKTIVCEKSILKTAQLLMTTLKDYLKETETIVIGYPILLNGKISDMAKEVEELKKNLENLVSNIPIILMDERLTSAQADRSLRELDLNRKERSKLIDTTAALYILQSYLDKPKNG
jgi:putative Holliday junction resolvase